MGVDGWVKLVPLCRLAEDDDGGELTLSHSSSFEKRDDFQPGAFEISPSHDDFTAVPSGEEFKIHVSYSRPIEGTSLLPLPS